MKVNRNLIRTRFGSDKDGEYVQAQAKGVIARHWGGEYIELLAGPKPTAFHVLNVGTAIGQEPSEELVANELAEFLEDTTAAELAEYRDSAGL